MHRVRRLLIFSLCACFMLLTLGACGHQQTTSSKRVTVTFWHGMVGEHKTALNKLIRHFNQSQSQYKVVGVAQGDFNGVQRKITAGAKSHTLPTIAQSSYTNVPEYVHGGFVTSFDHYITKHDLSDLYPAFRQSIRYQGKAYAMPFSKSAEILFYNTDILNQLNLSVPTTWEQVSQDATIAKAHGFNGMAFDQTPQSELDSLSKQSGTQLITNDPQKHFDVAKASTGAHVVWDMLQSKTATTAGSDGYGNVQFLKGQTLFCTGSSAGIAFMQSDTPKGMHWNTTSMPTYRGQQATTIQGNDIVMFKSASKQERQGAAAFVKYLMSTKATVQWAEATGYVPLTRSAQKNTSYQQYLVKHPYQKAAVASLKFGFQDPTFQGDSQYLTATQNAISKMVADHQTPEKALATLHKQVIKITKNN